MISWARKDRNSTWTTCFLFTGNDQDLASENRLHQAGLQNVHAWQVMKQIVLQLVYIYCPAHAHVRCQYIFLEAVPSQLFLHIRFQARNRVGLSASSTCEFWYICTGSTHCAWQPWHGDRPTDKRLQYIDWISAFDLGFGIHNRTCFFSTVLLIELPQIYTQIIINLFVYLRLQVLLVALFFPFNILYRSSRFFFLVCLFHCIAAPLYKVK